MGSRRSTCSADPIRTERRGARSRGACAPGRRDIASGRHELGVLEHNSSTTGDAPCRSSCSWRPTRWRAPRASRTPAEADRRDAIAAMAEGLGGKLESFYFALRRGRRVRDHRCARPRDRRCSLRSPSMPRGAPRSRRCCCRRRRRSTPPRSARSITGHPGPEPVRRATTASPSEIRGFHHPRPGWPE